MIYQYKCDACRGIVEVEHGMKENPVIKCLKCKKPVTRVVSGGAGVIFKGDGWPGQEIKRSREKKQ